jgi:hypothetical protein
MEALNGGLLVSFQCRQLVPVIRTLSNVAEKRNTTVYQGSQTWTEHRPVQELTGNVCIKAIFSRVRVTTFVVETQ